MHSNHQSIQACSMARCIADLPDVDLREHWLACRHGSLFYYLGLSELVGERNYDARTLLSDKTSAASARGYPGEPEHYWYWIDSGAY
jgi:hypothetical protein